MSSCPKPVSSGITEAPVVNVPPKVLQKSFASSALLDKLTIRKKQKLNSKIEVRMRIFWQVYIIKRVTVFLIVDLKIYL